MERDLSVLEICSEVREVVAQYGRLDVRIDEISDEDNLSEAGMNSHPSVDVMLALEDLFAALLEAMLTRSLFENIQSITIAMQSLHGNRPTFEKSAVQ